MSMSSMQSDTPVVLPVRKIYDRLIMVSPEQTPDVCWQLEI
jgi:hypothetical protein